MSATALLQISAQMGATVRIRILWACGKFNAKSNSSGSSPNSSRRRNRSINSNHDHRLNNSSSRGGQVLDSPEPVSSLQRERRRTVCAGPRQCGKAQASGPSSN
uniref:Uncharacterized protein n=1 Tax=Physcomitrium patens TaxID=3218 RepID=A0A2K1JH25_PHYPA|nr:hypothetical protein PHYPA_018260 [Physcomitrium patens]